MILHHVILHHVIPHHVILQHVILSSLRVYPSSTQFQWPNRDVGNCYSDQEFCSKMLYFNQQFIFDKYVKGNGSLPFISHHHHHHHGTWRPLSGCVTDVSGGIMETTGTLSRRHDDILVCCLSGKIYIKPEHPAVMFYCHLPSISTKWSTFIQYTRCLL